GAERGAPRAVRGADDRRPGGVPGRGDGEARPAPGRALGHAEPGRGHGPHALQDPRPGAAGVPIGVFDGYPGNGDHAPPVFRLRSVGGAAVGAALEYVEDDAWIEVTPSSSRLRKRALGATERRKLARNARSAEES